METPKDPREVVEALGGRDVVAAELDVGTSAISNWFKDGFPKSRMPDLLALADRMGAQQVTLALLLTMEAKYPERRKAAA